jgi:hypothetical protein
MARCGILLSEIHPLDVIQEHAKRLPRTSYAGSKNQIHLPLFSGLMVVQESGNRRSCRSSQREVVHITEGAFSFVEECRVATGKGFLFSTLAYQLAMNVPGMHEHVDSAMSKDSPSPDECCCSGGTAHRRTQSN